jgi:hypothetical protein
VYKNYFRKKKNLGASNSALLNHYSEPSAHDETPTQTENEVLPKRKSTSFHRNDDAMTV